MNDTSMSPDLKEACEHIDAALYSGDSLHVDADAREELRDYVYRWKRRLYEIDDEIDDTAHVEEMAKERAEEQNAKERLDALDVRVASVIDRNAEVLRSLLGNGGSSR